ncbi:MAG: hypothetical protein OXT06_29070 [Rhodospirillaceae bacterium]|nr:hypothetical protein [Rhodospirillaceae bacterium]
MAVTDDVPRLLMLEHHEHAPAHEGPALPFGPFEPDRHRTLEIALRGWIEEQTGLPVGYVEQLYTFGDRNRDPSERDGGPRVISVGYLALTREAPPSGDAEWRDAYDFLPWEDWRSGRPASVGAAILPALEHWAIGSADAAERELRKERLRVTFGAGDAPWDMERVLERYEVLYEAGLVAEAERDHGGSKNDGNENDLPHMAQAATGRLAALDHRRMMATALGRIRGKLRYRPVVFELLPENFTLLQLQKVAECLAGVSLHKQNFRRLVTNNRLVEPTGQQDRTSPGRPAELFRFRRDVLYERPAPGVGISARGGG